MKERTKMEARLTAAGIGGMGESEFNAILFEKKLATLKDSQESINNCCHWCLENRQHHKRIVSSWLTVLKRVKVDHRLTLFYLANDVIQYSKRRNYDFVGSWGTTLQKATTMVRWVVNELEQDLIVCFLTFKRLTSTLNISIRYQQAQDLVDPTVLCSLYGDLELSEAL